MGPVLRQLEPLALTLEPSGEVNGLISREAFPEIRAETSVQADAGFNSRPPGLRP